MPDDPETSPYPVWIEEGVYEEGVYEEGDKVVRLGEVFAAEWWSTGEDPAAPVEGAPTPWRLVGPVLESDRRPPPTTLPAGTHPEWDPAATYVEGDQGMVDGVGYEAQWWTQGDEPASRAPSPSPARGNPSPRTTGRRRPDDESPAGPGGTGPERAAA